jgi:hypothetical protein
VKTQRARFLHYSLIVSTGRGGALEISKQVTSKLQDKNRMSTKQLFEAIMKTEGSKAATGWPHLSRVLQFSDVCSR